MEGVDDVEIAAGIEGELGRFPEARGPGRPVGESVVSQLAGEGRDRPVGRDAADGVVQRVADEERAVRSKGQGDGPFEPRLGRFAVGCAPFLGRTGEGRHRPVRPDAADGVVR